MGAKTVKSNLPAVQQRQDVAHEPAQVELQPLGLQRAVMSPAQMRPAEAIRLQRVAGNRAVAQLLDRNMPGKRIQPKLTVGAANDSYEQEADRVAQQVMSSPAPAVQRETEEEELQTKPVVSTISRMVQRQEDEDELQTKGSSSDSFEAGVDVEQALQSNRGGGSPLSSETRSFMEPRFGADFSGVRVHTGGEAANLNRKIGAQAFTHGSDIYMGAGKYNPGTSAGDELLAHELTHTIQQGGTSAPVQRKLIGEATRAFDTAGGVEHVDPRGDVNNLTYNMIKAETDALVPTGEQEEIIKVRSAFSSMKKSPTREKKLKDVVRAYLFGQFAGRLRRAHNTLVGDELKKKHAFYYAHAIKERDKTAGLIGKGVDNEDTQTWLNAQHFNGIAELRLTPQEAMDQTDRLPRLDIRKTFISGANLRMHLYLVYTNQIGEQTVLRGGPSAGDPAYLVVDIDPYAPGHVDWDPSAPTVNLLQGDEAKGKLDGLESAAAWINAKQVTYQVGGMGGLVGGENCNRAAYTMLKMAGVSKLATPSGHFPGWGQEVGSTKGNKGLDVAKEGPDGEGEARKLRSQADEIPAYYDRLGKEKSSLPPESDVKVLKEFADGVVKVRVVAGGEIRFLHRGYIDLPAATGPRYTTTDETHVYSTAMPVDLIATLPTGSAFQIDDDTFDEILVENTSGMMFKVRYQNPNDGQQGIGYIQDYDLVGPVQAA